MYVALHSVIREGHERDYERDHSRIPEDLVESFGRLGIYDWRIWRSGVNLFHLVECDDFAAAMKALETDPANQRWQDFINQHVDHFELLGSGHEDMELPLVWQLAQQVGPTGN